MKKSLLLLIAFTAITFAKVQGQWISLNSGTTNTLSSVHFVSSDTGFVSDETGKIYKTNNGQIFNHISTVSTCVIKLNFINNITGLAAGCDISKTIDGGNTWTEVFSQNGYVFWDLQYLNVDTAIVVGADTNSWDGKVYMTYNGGSQWNLIGNFPSTLTYSGYFYNSKIGFVGDINGDIFKTIDGGNNWSQFNNASNYAIYSIYFTSKDTGYAVGDETGVTTTTDGGTSWSNVNDGCSESLLSVYFTSHDTGYTVGGNLSGFILKTNDAGNTWSQSATNSQNFYQVQFPNNNTGYAVGTNGTILKYTGNVSLNENLTEKNMLQIYPNPTNGNMSLSYELGENEEGTFDISDLTGRIVFSEKIIGGKNILPINTSQLEAGVYFYQAIMGNKKIAGDRIVIIK